VELMGCGRNEEDNERKHQDDCVCEVVRFIKRLQDAGTDDDCVECETDCFMAPLGSISSPARHRVNTRVFMLLTENGDPFKAMFRPESRKHYLHNCFSTFFRVQNVFDGCCATLQVLAPLDSNNNPVDIIKNGKLDLEELCNVEKFGATDSCITVDLNCFCGIQCIKDTYIDFCDVD